jgi:hypothetical protein
LKQVADKQGRVGITQKLNKNNSFLKAIITNLQALQGFQVLESSCWNALKFIIMKKSETERG